MNYEKKYKEMKARVLEIGRGYVKGVDFSKPRQIAEYIDPDLCESEDKKNIKNLIDELKCSLRAANCQNDACGGGHEKRIALLEWAISWLEKQGEQKPVKCIKLNNEFENQISHLIASVLNGEHEYNEGFVKYASQSLLGFAKKEQKPAEWSEEDKEMLKDIISGLKAQKSLTFAHDNQGNAQMNARIDWLQSLPEKFVLNQNKSGVKRMKRKENELLDFLKDGCPRLKKRVMLKIVNVVLLGSNTSSHSLIGNPTRSRRALLKDSQE